MVIFLHQHKAGVREIQTSQVVHLRSIFHQLPSISSSGGTQSAFQHPSLIDRNVKLANLTYLNKDHMKSTDSGIDVSTPKSAKMIPSSPQPQGVYTNQSILSSVLQQHLTQGPSALNQGPSARELKGGSLSEPRSVEIKSRLATQSVSDWRAAQLPRGTIAIDAQLIPVSVPPAVHMQGYLSQNGMKENVPLNPEPQPKMVKTEVHMPESGRLPPASTLLPIMPVENGPKERQENIRPAGKNYFPIALPLKHQTQQ